MASIPAVIRQIRRSRRAADARVARDFEEHVDAYREILQTVQQLDGERSVDALAEWTVQRIEEDGQVPEPDRLRGEARRLLEHRDVNITEGSPLQS